MNYAYMVALIALALVLGGLVGYFARQIIANQQVRNARKEAQKLLDEATVKYDDLLRSAREEANRLSRAAEVERKERRVELQQAENRFHRKEEAFERKLESIERRQRDLDKREAAIESTRDEIAEIKQQQLATLVSLSGVSRSEAETRLMEAIRGEVEEEASKQVRSWQARVKEEADKESQYILATAIQRCSTDVVSQVAVSTVDLPSDEMKGRLIGREGRNIRALEQATGVDLIVDDTPEVVTISSFDSVRREIARLALNKLVLDGRIHPARIEEVVAKTRAEVESIIISEGERAAYEANVPGLHPELIKLLGRLKFRTSYGQNVLLHSLEVSYLAGMLADEIGVDGTLARTAGLLHDIGKAVDHEVEGSHAAIGANLVLQWTKSEAISQAVAEHHGEAETSSVLGFIVAAADSISGSRPGARRESMEQYLKRVKDLENIASSFSGVEKVFAIQAGREVRIMVKPDQVDDLIAVRLSRDISKKIEENLSYPGQIKVVVVRETTAVDYAK
jgi:ribonucrease Y